MRRCQPSLRRRGCLQRRNRARCAELMNEPVSGLVVAEVLAKETVVGAGELLSAVCAERLDALVAPARAPLLVEQLRPVWVVGKVFGHSTHVGAEALRGVAEGVVEEPDLDGAPRANGFERGRGEAIGHLGAYAAREQVGPILRAGK